MMTPTLPLRLLGGSFGGCLHDLYLGQVDLSDVVLISTQTRGIDPRENHLWEAIWKGYSEFDNGLANHWTDLYKDPHAKKGLQNLAIELYEAGRIHQPRSTTGFRTLSLPRWQVLFAGEYRPDRVLRHKKGGIYQPLTPFLEVTGDEGVGSTLYRNRDTGELFGQATARFSEPGRFTAESYPPKP